MTCPCGQWPITTFEQEYALAREYVDQLLDLVDDTPLRASREMKTRRDLQLVDDARRFLREAPIPE